jgi:hypothetical protein
VADSLSGTNPKTMLLASFHSMNFDGNTNAQAFYDKAVARLGEKVENAGQCSGSPWCLCMEPMKPARKPIPEKS